MPKAYVVEVVITDEHSDACAMFTTKEKADLYKETLQARNPDEYYFVSEWNVDPDIEPQ